MTDDYWLEEACEGDEYQIAEVTAEAWRSAYRGILPSEFLARLDLNRWVKRVRDRRQEGVPTLVVGSGERILGTAHIVRSDEAGYEHMAELKAIYVRPEAQGMGLGKALVRQCALHAQGLGFESMCCCAFKDNQQAREFYLALGALINGEIVCNVNGVDYLDTVFVWQDLHGLLTKFGPKDERFRANRPGPH